MCRMLRVWLSLFWTRTETDQTKSLSSCITGIKSNVYLVSSSYYLEIRWSLLWLTCFIKASRTSPKADQASLLQWRISSSAMQISWKTNIFQSLTTVGWATTPVWCWGNRLLSTNKLLHHNSLSSLVVNELPAILPNNCSPWGTWWALRCQINLGIFFNSQGYLKPIRLLTCNQRSRSMPCSCRHCQGRGK